MADNTPVIIVSDNRNASLHAALTRGVHLISPPANTNNANTATAETFTHPDLKLITETPSIGITAVKDLINYISRKPYQSNVVVGIIHPGETLTTEAQNSLLKTLEEPPDFAHIFLTTTHLSVLLPTVRSRCTVIALSDNAKFVDPPVAIADLIKLPLSKQLKTIDSLTRDKNVSPKVVEEWIDQWIFAARGDDPSLLRKLVSAKRLLRSNVTPLHALDTLLVS